MIDITEFVLSPSGQQIFYIVGMIGLMFVLFCMLVVIGDELFQLYEYLQRKRRDKKDAKLQQHTSEDTATQKIVIGIISAVIFMLVGYALGVPIDELKEKDNNASVQQEDN